MEAHMWIPGTGEYGKESEHDYVRIPGGSEDGGSHVNTRDRWVWGGV